MTLAQTVSTSAWEQVGNFGPDPFFATGSTSYQAPAFNAAANSIIVVSLVISGAGNHTVSGITNNGTGLTWNRVIRRTATPTASGDGAQNEEIWYALNTAEQLNLQYTVTWTENTDNYTGFARGHTRVFTGHDTSTPFPSSAAYSGTNPSSKPQLATAVTQVTGGVVVGAFTDGESFGTLSSANADTTNGIVNRSGDQNSAFYVRGLSDSLAAGSFQPSMNTDEAASIAFTGVFAVLAPAPVTTFKRGPGIGRY
jgi:hypothetical protein